MKKVIKLTEEDLIKIVRKVLKEQDETQFREPEVNQEILAKVYGGSSSQSNLAEEDDELYEQSESSHSPALKQFISAHPELKGTWTEKDNNWIYKFKGKVISVKGGPHLSAMGFDNVKNKKLIDDCKTKKHPIGSNEQIRCYYVGKAMEIKNLG